MINLPRVMLGKGFAVIGPRGPIPAVVENKKTNGWPKKLKKGRFTNYCKRSGFAGPSSACATKAMKSSDSSVRGMAAFYNNTVKK